MVTSVIDVSAAEFTDSVVRASHQIPVVVDLWAEWCGPCKTLGPTLERMAGEGGGRWLLAKVDVDANPQIAQQLGVQGIPTVVAFKDGQEVSRFTGAIPEPQVRQFIDGLLPSELDIATLRADDLLDQGDVEGALEIYRAVLDRDPTHEDAGLSLAGALIDAGDHADALDVLSRLAPTEPVRQLQALARLGEVDVDVDALADAAESGTAADRLAHARALAASGDHQAAIGRLMAVIGERVEPESEGAREVLLDLFELLGADDPVVADTRRRLANGLY